MEEITYSDDERRAICVWLYHRKPFPTYFSWDDALYADILQTLTDMGHERERQRHSANAGQAVWVQPDAGARAG